jgi:hypothetical protein
MSDVVALDERIKRMTALTAKAPVIEDHGLVQLLSATEIHRSRIRNALNMLLWSCLTSHFSDKKYELSEDMLRDYEQDVIQLPNITPNGLVLPKKENLLAYNQLQKEVSGAFAALGVSDNIARIQFPVNVRLQSGTPNSIIDSRPRASVKPHSDIWAGDPASGVLVFLSVLGDPAKSGIDFLMPETFPLSFVRPLEDYNEGAPLAEKAKLLCKFDTRGWYFADPYLIHQTTKNASGYRISIDFRFIPAQKVSSDIDEDEARRPWFKSFAEWQDMGTKTLLVTDECMADFAATKTKDPYTVGYPVKLSLMDIEADYDNSVTQKAS